MRPWTGKEMQFLRQNYLKRDLADIARALQRSRWSVWTAARRCGLPGRGRKLTPEAMRRLLSLWERGWTAPAIAVELGCSRQYIRSCLRNLSLAANADSAAARERRRQARRRQAAAMGLRKIGQLPSLVRRQRLLKAGWPDAQTITEARVLETLAASEGDLRHIASALGWHSLNGLRIHVNRLVRRGLISRRRVGHFWLYSVSHGVRKRGI